MVRLIQTVSQAMRLVFVNLRTIQNLATSVRDLPKAITGKHLVDQQLKNSVVVNLHTESKLEAFYFILVNAHGTQ
ncbi:hypothetical protein PsgB076_27525 [Pseudomonas savastanoi pv. glycinea str. B076]|nr:hypothetical protein PsgB076_27525 [Pseudomonas savastanoi pv. glycinea str. B076]